jgi:hypothetical protein
MHRWKGIQRTATATATATGAATLAAVSVLAGFCGGCVNRATSAGASGNVETAVRLGEEGTAGYVPIATSERDLREYLKAEDAFDAMAMRHLTESGRVTLIPKGAPAYPLGDGSPVNGDKTVAHVRIAEGAMAGKEVVVPQTFVRVTP